MTPERSTNGLHFFEDSPTPERLAQLVEGTVFAGGVRYFSSIASTSLAAMQAGQEGAPSGSVWLADEQTAGKGRAGHQWHSPAGTGLYLSALLRPRLAPSEVIILSLAAGLSVVRAVREVTSLEADLRWPNDVLFGDKKFCGILTEMNSEATRVRYVAVGMGLNVHQESFPADIAEIATSLRIESDREFDRAELAGAILRALDEEHRALEADPIAARQSILRRFEAHSSYCRAAEVWVEEDGGYEGTTRGLDERGFLRVETAAGMKTVLSGGVRKR
jgi:BirA family biotin operon repressor/biotin-[acetyl-CoA-carboxylase] ligase